MSYLETKTYRLSTLSPIHIRAGADKEYGQAFIRLEDDFIYIVDTPVLQRELFTFGGLDAVNAYAEAFSNPDRRTNIVTVLRRIGYDYKTNIEKISNEVISADGVNRPLPAPKSRRFVLENDEPIYPLGWVQLSEVANE